MPLLTVYKASAGSGKTWRLTVEYLKFLLQRPDAYRHILAVTFTNKATSEMKERILNALWEMRLIHPSKAPEGMAKTLSEETGLPPALIKERAIQALRLLLHDYGHFRVETIDSFFQSVLRNLARELGIGTGLNIELNDAAVLDEAVDAVLDHSSEDPLLLNWITDFMEESYREGKSWKIDRALRKFGKTIFQEFFKEKSVLLNEKLKDKQFLDRYKKELQAYQARALDQLKKAATAYFSKLKENGLEISDISNGNTGVSSYFLKLSNGQCNKEIAAGKRVQEAMEDPEKWAAKKHPRHDDIVQLAVSDLMPLLKESEKLRANLAPGIHTCKLCIRHLTNVGLLTDIHDEVRTLNHSSNRFLLSDTNALLRSLISEQDTSFVFEKTGTEFDHILFDEFQDTSRMQWETFKPLLAECLARGHKSLVVGDEKQSIYRWRNGDWRILGNITEELKHSDVGKEVLRNNWRSDQLVVDFNNRLFQTITKLVNQHLSDQFNQACPDIEKAYTDVIQEPVKHQGTGFVSVEFPKGTDETPYTEQVLQRLLTQTEDLQRQGIPANQIAILIRVNKHAPANVSASPDSNLLPALCLQIRDGDP